jgi:hypothetical protein
MTLAIEAVGLVKRFGKTLAVDGVDLAGRAGRDPGVALHRLEYRDHRRLRAAGRTPIPPHRLAGIMSAGSRITAGEAPEGYPDGKAEPFTGYN